MKNRFERKIRLDANDVDFESKIVLRNHAPFSSSC